ncbi:MAG: 16S rRNA (cytosine(1402)-N(4))-methyltransferase RsmH [candidate division WOR-3 bacterium]
MDKFHEPVLVAEVIAWMNLKDDGIYCDCTVGGGGHLLKMLEYTRNARFVGIDWDPEAIAYVQKCLGDFRERVDLYEENYIYLDQLAARMNIKGFNGILFDLGASWHQLTTPERGFSFNLEGKLLMQMSPAVFPLYEKLHRTNPVELYGILKEYGDVPNARKLAKFIYQRRNELKTTIDLRRLIERHSPQKLLKKNLHKVFQALRIWTNEELKNLRVGLEKAINLLQPQGRLIVIAYHSGEDRIVKEIFKKFEKNKTLKLLHKKVIRPNAEEVRRNPAARSARMRVGEKCASC